jgi:hypothetical protein
MSELQLVTHELTATLQAIENSEVLSGEWRAYQWSRTERIAKQAAEVAGQLTAIEKLAVYAQYKGELWREAFETQEDWVGDLTVHRSMSRATFFSVVREIEMARMADKSWVEIAHLLAKVPAALRDAKNLWLDSEGVFRQLVMEPGEALDQMAELSPTEARAHARAVAGLPRIFISQTAHDGSALLMTMVVEAPGEATRAVDLVLERSDREPLAYEDAAFLARRVGKSLR